LRLHEGTGGKAVPNVRTLPGDSSSAAVCLLIRSGEFLAEPTTRRDPAGSGAAIRQTSQV